MADQRSPMEFDAETIPEVLPILPLYDAALFPKMVLPLVVMQGESVKLVDEAMAKDRIIGLIVSKKPEEKKSPDKEDLAAVGTSALILKMAKSEDERDFIEYLIRLEWSGILWSVKGHESVFIGRRQVKKQDIHIPGYFSVITIGLKPGPIRVGKKLNPAFIVERSRQIAQKDPRYDPE